MLRITLEQWRMFKSVVEYGGFNQASEGVNKSQSSIHNAVGKIEDTLGVKLFKVVGRKTEITKAGEMMLRRANYLLEEAAKVEAVGQTLGEGIEAQLRVAVDEVFPQRILYEVLDSISSQYPLLNIEMMESVLAGANELLENGEADIAISPIELGDSFSEELCQIEMMAVACPSHPLHQLDRELELQDLRSCRQIVVRDSAVSHEKDEGWLGANQRWTVSHMRTSIDMISKGLGFAWLPVISIDQELVNGSLLPLKLKQGRIRNVQLHLVFKDADRLGPAARSFIGELRHKTLSLPTSESV